MDFSNPVHIKMLLIPEDIVLYRSSRWKCVQIFLIFTLLEQSDWVCNMTVCHPAFVVWAYSQTENSRTDKEGI